MALPWGFMLRHLADHPELLEPGYARRRAGRGPARLARRPDLRRRDADLVRPAARGARPVRRDRRLYAITSQGLPSARGRAGTPAAAVTARPASADDGRRQRARRPDVPGAARPASTRRGSSSMSPGSRRTSLASRARWTRAGSPSGRTPRPTRASRSPGSRSTPGRAGSRSARSARPRCSSRGGIDDVFLAYPLWADGPKAARLRARPRRGGPVPGRHRLGRRGRSPGRGGGGRGAAREPAAGRPRRGRSRQPPDRARLARRPWSRSPARRASRRSRGRGRVQPRRPRLRLGAAATAGADEVRTLEAAAAALRTRRLRDRHDQRRIDADDAQRRGRRRDRDAGRDLRLRRPPAMGARGDPGRRLRRRGRDDRRVGPRRSGRPRCRGEDADEGPRRVADRVRRDRRLPRPRDRARERLPRRRRRAAGGRPARVSAQVVAVIPNHVCPVIDLVDAVVAVRADGAIEEWPVDARGRSG